MSVTIDRILAETISAADGAPPDRAATMWFRIEVLYEVLADRTTWAAGRMR